MRVARSIVLIDDDRDDQEIFRIACSRVDRTAEFLGFETGEQAVKRLSEKDFLPDIVFLDLNMPRMNGIEVLTLLKKDPILKNVPVVIYTTSFDDTVKEKCTRLGAIDVVEKPNNFEGLCCKIKSTLQTFVNKQYFEIPR